MDLTHSMDLIQLSGTLNNINTRNEIQTATKEMMDTFNKLNEEYNKIAEITILDKYFQHHLNLDEEKVFLMINKAKKDIKHINEQTSKLKQMLGEYDEYKNYCKELNDGIEKIKNIYENLSKKINTNINISVKLDLNRQLFSFDFLNQIKCLENDIDTFIFKIEQELTNNYKKISDFKRLVKFCLKDDDKPQLINICSICVTNRINTCLNPCGHTFCLNCINKMNNKCGMCRNNIISKIKIFLEYEDSNENEETYDASGNFAGFSGFNNSNELLPSHTFETYHHIQ